MTPAAAQAADTAPDTAPFHLQRLTAARLADAGIPVSHAATDSGPVLAVRFPAPPSRGRRARKKRGTRCTVTVDDAANAELNLHPWPGGAADPYWLADIAAALLTGEPGHGHRHPGTQLRNLTLKGTAGMDLRQRGFDVTLNVYEDEHYYEVAADISAAVTATADEARQDAGTVFIGDDGILCWKRDRWRQHETGQEPSLTWPADSADVASAVAGAVAAAIRAARPAHRRETP